MSGSGSSPRPSCQSVPGKSREAPAESPSKSRGKIIRKPPGLKNFGFTCYANVIVQCIFSFTTFWLTSDVIHNQRSEFSKSLLSLLTLMKSSYSSLQPVFFLRSLAKLFTLEGYANFNYNSCQDVVEVLKVVVEELSDSLDIWSSTTAEIECFSMRVNCFAEKCDQVNSDVLLLPSVAH